MPVPKYIVKLRCYLCFVFSTVNLLLSCIVLTLLQHFTLIA